MILNCTREVVFKTDYSDVEELILKVYGHEYEIMPMEEVGSSQYSATYDMTAKKEELGEYEYEELLSLRNGKPKQFMLNTIITDLCNGGYIEEGEYIIGVSW